MEIDEHRTKSSSFATVLLLLSLNSNTNRFLEHLWIGTEGNEMIIARSGTWKDTTKSVRICGVSGRDWETWRNAGAGVDKWDRCRCRYGFISGSRSSLTINQGFSNSRSSHQVLSNDSECVQLQCCCTCCLVGNPSLLMDNDSRSFYPHRSGYIQPIFGLEWALSGVGVISSQIAYWPLVYVGHCSHGMNKGGGGMWKSYQHSQFFFQP